MAITQLPPVVKGKLCDSRNEAACECERIRALSGVRALAVPTETVTGLKYRIMWQDPKPELVA